MYPCNMLIEFAHFLLIWNIQMYQMSRNSVIFGKQIPFRKKREQPVGCSRF